MTDSAALQQIADRRWRRGLLLCLGMAAIARAGIALYAGLHPARFDYPDSHRYVTVADNITAGRGPMESLDKRCGTDPAYPYLLSIGQLGGADSFEATMNWGRVVNALLGIATIAAAMRLARRAGGIGAAIVAGLILAIDPIFLFFHGLVLTEVMFTCLLLWAIEWLICATETGRIGYAALSGLFLGVAALTRSSGILMPTALLPLLLFSGSSSRKGRLVAAWLVSFGLALAPTTIRNYRLLNAFVPVRTGMGETLLDSFGDWADGGTGMQRVVWPEFPADATELDRERICRQTVADWIAEHPRRSFELAWAKLKRTWSITLHAPGYQGGIFDLIAWLTVAPVYLLAFAGAFHLRRRPALVYALIAPALYVTLVHCVFVGSVRYRIPAVPGLIILAGTAVAAAFHRPESARAT